MKEEDWLYFEFFLASELGMTVNRLRNELTDTEFIYWSSYYELKTEREKAEMEKSKRGR